VLPVHFTTICFSIRVAIYSVESFFLFASIHSSYPIVEVYIMVSGIADCRQSQWRCVSLSLLSLHVPDILIDGYGIINAVFVAAPSPEAPQAIVFTHPRLSKTELVHRGYCMALCLGKQ
jgi:hypothetical protein